MKTQYVIAHDLGTSSDKAILLSTKGDIIQSTEARYAYQSPNPGWVEQNPQDYWQAVVNTTHKLMRSSGVAPTDIIGIVYTTQAMGVIPIDKNGSLLYPNITWVDGRAEDQAIAIMKRFGGRKAFKALVGIELTGKDVIPKLLWLKEKCTEIYNKTALFLDVNGYLKFRSTNKAVSEWSGACSYAFNLKKKDWERVFFKISGIDLNKLPPLVKSTDKVGGLTDEAARELGLLSGTAVYGGCDDTQSAAIGSGAGGEGEAHIYLGTSAWAGVTTEKVYKFKNGAVCLQSADPQKNLVVGITESAGNNLEWFIEQFYKEEKSRLTTEEIYHLIEGDIKKTSAGSDHLIFTPWLLGERCPVGTTTTRGTLFNVGLEHTRGHFIRALGEGIGYNLRWIIDNMEKDFKFNISSLRITGGGSQSDVWMQGIADITGHTIETTSQPKTAGALGASMCALVGSGCFNSFADIKKLIKTAKRFEPQKENKALYDELFQLYKRLYFALRSSYKKANRERFKR